MFKFGKNSTKQLLTCEDDLQLILMEAIKVSKIDFGISEGHRTVEKQQEYYAIGRTIQLHRRPITNVDGINKLSKHNYNPSFAVDLYIWHPNKAMRQRIAFDRVHLAYVSGIIDGVADRLYQEEVITHKIRWGANWNNDRVIDYDQNFDDFPHFELVN